MNDMKNKINLIFCLCLAFVLTSCQVDERVDDLTASYHGAFIDKITGDTVATEYYAAKLKLLDLKYGDRAVPLEYDVHPSGAFKNKHIYPSDYKIWADGPFMELDTLFSNLKDYSQPLYLAVVPNVSLKIDKIEVKYGIAAEVTYSYDVNDKQSSKNEAGVVYGTGIYPGFKTALDESNKDALVKKRIRSVDNIKGTLTEVIYLSPSSKYHIRALGKTENAGDYWNYSKQRVIETGPLDLAQLPVEANLGVSSSTSAILQWAFPPIVDRVELSYKDADGLDVKDSFGIEEYSYVANLPAAQVSKINVQLFLGDVAGPVRTIDIETKKKYDKYVPAASRPENVPFFNDVAFKKSLSGRWAEIKGPSVDPSWVTSPSRWEFFDWWNTWLGGGAGNMPSCGDVEDFIELKLYGHIKTLVDILPFINLETLYILPGEAFDAGKTIDTNVDLRVLKKLKKLKKVILGPGVTLGEEHFKEVGLDNIVIEKQ